jgi:RNA polymerase sigma-70 factor (ECF subfamily)
VQTERIVKECLKGNEGAWQMLVNTYSRRIFSLAYQFSGTREEAEDMTQEIFLKLYNSLKKFDFSRNFDAEYSLKETTEIGPEDAVLREETKKRVWDGFNYLSADIRMAIILRDIQGKKYEEVAEIMDLPLGTIKSRVNRGRIQLAKVLKEQKEKENEM